MMRWMAVLPIAIVAFSDAAPAAAQAVIVQFERDVAQVEPGSALTARVVLGAASATDSCVTLSSSQPSLLAVPANLVIKAGATTANFPVRVGRGASAAAVSVSVTASVAPCFTPLTGSRALTVLPPARVAAVSAAPTSVVGGAGAKLELKLDRAAAHPGVSVAVTNDGGGTVSHAGAVTVPAGQQAASLAVATQPVGGARTVTLSASAAGTAAASAALTLLSGSGAGEPAGLAGITEAHNSVRAGVGVPPLRWSAALAATAQQWANSCTGTSMITHNPSRSVGHPYYVGENLFAASGTATPAAAVSAWASEAAQYDYASNTCTGGTCGHYTQVVWRDSVELGCGIANCPNLAFRSNIVCNYGPGGNIGGQRPY